MTRIDSEPELTIASNILEFIWTSARRNSDSVTFSGEMIADACVETLHLQYTGGDFDEFGSKMFDITTFYVMALDSRVLTSDPRAMIFSLASAVATNIRAAGYERKKE